MTLKEKVRLYSTRAAIKGTLRILPRISDEITGIKQVAPLRS